LGRGVWPIAPGGSRTRPGCAIARPPGLATLLKESRRQGLTSKRTSNERVAHPTRARAEEGRLPKPPARRWGGDSPRQRGTPEGGGGPRVFRARQRSVPEGRRVKKKVGPPGRSRPTKAVGFGRTTLPLDCRAPRRGAGFRRPGGRKPASGERLSALDPGVAARNGKAIAIRRATADCASAGHTRQHAR